MIVTTQYPSRSGDEGPAVLDAVQERVFLDRYALKGSDGQPLERTPDDLWRRVARAIAAVEPTPALERTWAERFAAALRGFKFVPGGRILSGAGSGHAVTLFNCFVVPSPEDSRAGILDNLKLVVEIMARGGGVGVNLSSLRPRGSYIRTVNGTSSGPCAWAELYSVATGDVIQQGGSRRGALMLMLDDWHPDVEEFITVKTDLRRLVHANLSVCISDAFMQAVKDDADWPLVWQGEVKKVVRARALWDRICTAAWQSAEPGLLFIDRVNALNNLAYCETIRCCNPSLRAGTRVLTRDGILPIEELQGRDFLVKNLDGQWSPARCFLSGRNKRLWKVTLANGVEVYATAEHRWPVALTGGGFAKTTTSRLRPGNFLPYPTVGKPGVAGTLGRTRDQGFMLGWLYGDGWIVTRSDNGQATFGFLFSTADRPLAERVLTTVNEMTGGGSTLREGKDGTYSFQVTSRAFSEVLLNEWGVRDKAGGLPRCVWIASEEFREGFIDGLLSADGSVTCRPPRIALSTTHRKLAEDFAELMSFYGIKSAVQSFRNNRSGRLPNGREYVRTDTRHQVNLDFHRAAQFSSLFHLSHEEKQRRLRRLAERAFALKPYDVGLIRVAAVEETELHEDVWDISVSDDTHCFQIGHCVTGNCGEEPLAPFNVCNLGALNLAAFVRDGQLDARALSETTQVAVRFLDNVIEATPYFLPENEAAQKGVRRVGLGTMGLADALIALGVRYGSDESLAAIEEIYRTIRDAAYDASADLAAEKGPFPKFDRDRFLERPFIRRLPEPIRAKIAAHGIRNGTLLCQAPTGTTSLLAGVSSGIEPVFDFRLVRRDRLGEHVIEHPAYAAWRRAHPDTQPPAYFVTASELSPEEHVRVQAKIQEHTDAAISKCVTGDTLIATKQGILPIADLYADETPDSFRRLALGVASLGGCQTASQFYFGGVRPTRRIRLQDGRMLTGTPNHRVYVGTEEGLVWKCLGELTPGDLIAIKIGAQTFGCDLPLTGFRQSTVVSGYQKLIRVPSKMTPDLAHFVGAWCAEGHIDHYTVTITNNERPVLERLNESADRLFGVSGTIAPGGRGKALSLRINSKSLCEFLRFLGCTKGAANKTIPWAILQSSRKSLVAFLSGLYLDGYVTRSKIGISLASDVMIRQLQVVLDTLGVQSWISPKHNVRYGRTYLELNAHGREAQKLGRLLAFDEAHKIERCAALLRREFRPSSMDRVPAEGRESVFASAPRSVRYRHHAYSQAVTPDRANRRLSWSGLHRLATDPGVVLPPALREIHDENLHFRAVVAVEDAGPQPVYDLTVPANQAFVGNGIVNHNTTNAPKTHTVEEVQRLYQLAYELGCKGITYYRDGSRPAVLSHAEGEPATANGLLRRPRALQGTTYRTETPLGTAFVTVNTREGAEGREPFEVFLNVGKAGSDIAALAEAIGRLCSLCLRLPCQLPARERVAAIVHQLGGIGGGRALGFGARRVRSLPDAVARVLAEAAELDDEMAAHQGAPAAGAGDLCPSCGEATLAHREGCRSCPCGFSEC
jgi:ribonucleoside-diphosphate reductase alpha chain